MICRACRRDHTKSALLAERQPILQPCSINREYLMDVHETQVVDGREKLLQIDGQIERFGVSMQLSLAGKE